MGSRGSQEPLVGRKLLRWASLMCFTCVPAESDVLAGDGSPRMGVRPGGGGKADFCDRPFNVRWRVCAREPEVVQPGGSCVRVHGRWVCFPALGRRRVQHGTLGGTEESDRPDGLAGDRRGERAQCESGAESGGAGMRRVVTAGCWAGLSPGDFRRLHHPQIGWSLSSHIKKQSLNQCQWF